MRFAPAANLPLDWHETHHSGDTIERVQKSGNALFSFAQNQIIYLQNAVSLIGPIAAIFVLSVPTGAAVLAGYLLIAAVLVRFDREMLKLNRGHNRAHARYADCLGNVATVLTLRLQEPTRRLLGERLRASFAPLRSSIVLNEGKWCAIDLLNNAIRFDRAILMAEGRVIAGGTLKTLLEREPLFQELWQRQGASPEVQRPAYAARLSAATIAAAIVR